jgi:hypothetical protein
VESLGILHMPDPEVKAHRTGRYWFVGVLMTTTARAYCSIAFIPSFRTEWDFPFLMS